MNAEDKLIIWRHDRLIDAGYKETWASLLAETKEVDLHEAIDLLDHGCSPELAVSILS